MNEEEKERKNLTKNQVHSWKNKKTILIIINYYENKLSKIEN